MATIHNDAVSDTNQPITSVETHPTMGIPNTETVDASGLALKGDPSHSTASATNGDAVEQPQAAKVLEELTAPTVEVSSNTTNALDTIKTADKNSSDLKTVRQAENDSEDVVHPKDATVDSTTTIGSAASEATTVVGGNDNNDTLEKQALESTKTEDARQSVQAVESHDLGADVSAKAGEDTAAPLEASHSDMAEIEPTPPSSSTQDPPATPVTKEAEAQQVTQTVPDDPTAESAEETPISSEGLKLRGNTQSHQQDGNESSDTQPTAANVAMDTTNIPTDVDSKELTQGDDAATKPPNAPATEETTAEPDVKVDTEKVGLIDDIKADDSETRPIEIAERDDTNYNNVYIDAVDNKKGNIPGNGSPSMDNLLTVDDTSINVQIVAATPAQEEFNDEEMDTPKADNDEPQIAEEQVPATVVKTEEKAETAAPAAETTADTGDKEGASSVVPDATQPDNGEDIEDVPAVEDQATAEHAVKESQPRPESVTESQVEATPAAAREPEDVGASRDEAVPPVAEEAVEPPKAQETVSEEVIENVPAKERAATEVERAVEEEPVAEVGLALEEGGAANGQAGKETGVLELTASSANEETHVPEEEFPSDAIAANSVSENVVEEQHSDVREQQLASEKSVEDEKTVGQRSSVEERTVTENPEHTEGNQIDPVLEPAVNAPVMEVEENKPFIKEEHAADSAPEIAEPVAEDTAIVQERPAHDSVEAVEETRAPEDEEVEAGPAESGGTKVPDAGKVEQPVVQHSSQTQEETVVEEETNAADETDAPTETMEKIHGDPVVVEDAVRVTPAPVSGTAENPAVVEEIINEKVADEGDVSKASKDIDEHPEIAEEPLAEAQSIAESTPLNEIVTEVPSADGKSDAVEHGPSVDEKVEDAAVEEKLSREELLNVDSASALTVEKQPVVEEMVAGEIPAADRVVEESLPERAKVIPAEPDIEEAVVSVTSDALHIEKAMTVESIVGVSVADPKTTSEDATAVPAPVEHQESIAQVVEEPESDEGTTISVEDKLAPTEVSFSVTHSSDIDTTAETVTTSESVPEDKGTTEELVAEDVLSSEDSNIEPFAGSDKLTPVVHTEEGSHLERPKSPWTPSFQVTTIGHGVALSEESDIPAASLDASEENVPEVSTIAPVTISVNGESAPAKAEASTSREPVETNDNASLSWTPSYSVHSQGSPSPRNMSLEPEISEVEATSLREEQIPEKVAASPPEISIDETPAIMTRTDTEDVKDIDKSVPAEETLITEPSTVETGKDEQSNEPILLVLDPGADHREASEVVAIESQEEAQEETAGSTMQIAESSSVYEAQPSESRIVPDVEGITEFVEENVSLTPPVGEVRPASPSWVPSYSVSKQGSPTPVEAVLPSTTTGASNPLVSPTAGVEEAKDTEAAIPEPPTLVVNDAKPEAFAEEDEHVQERPSTPWTPSYSVTKQGPDVIEEDKIDVIESLSQSTDVKAEDAMEQDISKSVSKGSPAFSTAGLIGAGIAGGAGAALAASAVLGGSFSKGDNDKQAFESGSMRNGDGAVKDKVFPTVEIPAEENKPTMGGLPSLDENSAVDTSFTSPSPETSPVFSRKRLESTTSSRLFPGGWFSPTSKIPDERASLELAQGEFTAARSNPDETLLSPLPEPVTPVQERASSDKKRWCIIM